MLRSQMENTLKDDMSAKVEASCRWILKSVVEYDPKCCGK
jgi:hypothetical protein